MPLLVYVLGVPTKVAVGTDLFEVFISASYETISHAIKGNVAIMIALVTQTGAAVGGADWRRPDAIFSRPANPLGVLAPALNRAALIAYRASNEIIEYALMAATSAIRGRTDFVYGILPSAAMPRIKRITHMTEKRKTNNFAIAAAPPAMSVLPNTAVANAITKKMPAHRTIYFTPGDDSKEPIVLRASHCHQNKTMVVREPGCG